MILVKVHRSKLRTTEVWVETFVFLGNPLETGSLYYRNTQLTVGSVHNFSWSRVDLDAGMKENNYNETSELKCTEN